MNCNSTKGNKDVVLGNVLLPDRDNTFVAFRYAQDGAVSVDPGLPPTAATQARATLALVGLDKRIGQSGNANAALVAIDRCGQRMEAWATAEEARNDVTANPNVLAVRNQAVRLAVATGFFSVWIEAFASDADMQNRLIDAFRGTRNSGCFAPATAAPVRPAPNPDRLAHGGKV